MKARQYTEEQIINVLKEGEARAKVADLCGPKPDNDAAMRQRLRELAGQRKWRGSPRLHIMLKREGLVIHDRTSNINTTIMDIVVAFC